MVIYDLASPMGRVKTKPKFALLVIDMQDTYHSDMRSIHFGLPRLDALVDLICFARTRDVPIHLLEYMGAGDTFGRLTALTPKLAKYQKCDLDGFTNLAFRSEMMRLRDDHTLIVGGYNYSACVYRTVQTAVDLGFSVATSPDLLFYSRNSASQSPDREDKVTAFYNSHLAIAPNVRGLFDLVSNS